jgi:hypothetical protein
MNALLLAASALTSEPTSAPVTQWPLRILLVLLVLAVIALVLAGMRAGWPAGGAEAMPSADWTST